MLLESGLGKEESDADPEFNNHDHCHGHYHNSRHCLCTEAENLTQDQWPEAPQAVEKAVDGSARLAGCWSTWRIWGKGERSLESGRRAVELEMLEGNSDRWGQVPDGTWQCGDKMTTAQMPQIRVREGASRYMKAAEYNRVLINERTTKAIKMHG